MLIRVVASVAFDDANDVLMSGLQYCGSEACMQSFFFLEKQVVVPCIK
jgi:hypothetical protein